MFDIAIYSKTPKGRAELTERTLGLNLRLRRALIMIDGKTPFNQLSLMLETVGDAKDLVRQLRKLRLIESDYDLPDMPEFPGMMLEDPSTMMDFHPNR